MEEAFPDRPIFAVTGGTTSFAQRRKLRKTLKESGNGILLLAKEKINLFMKGQNTDLDEIYDRFGVDYDLLSLLMHREMDEKGNFHIRWGEQQIA